MRRLLLACVLLLLSFAFFQTASAQTTWTGATSTAWTTAGNWSAGVPDANDDVIIPDVARDPLISAAGAVAKSVNVQSGGSLTVTAAGVLAVNGSATVGLLNVGTVNNSGTILVGNVTGPASHGVQNGGTFNNNSGALLTVDRISSVPSAVHSGNGTFTNAGTITIGGIASGSQHGLYVDGGNFTNAATGIINIDRVNIHGVYTTNTAFNNSGVINVGMTNTGTTIFYGFTLDGPGSFNNLVGGAVNISRCRYGLYLFSAPFNNAGTVTIGKAGGVTDLLRVGQLFYNNTGGVFNASGNVQSSHFVNAGGTVSPGYSAPGTLSYDASEDFSSSTLQMEVNGKASAGSDYDRINVTGTATLGGTLALNINYTPTAGDQIILLSATAITGTFSSVTGLPANWRINYTPVSVFLSFGAPAVKTWNGSVSTDWNTAANWTGGRPTAADDVTIPNVANDPVIGTAGGLAKSVRVETGALLTLSAGANLVINNGTYQGFWNQGTVNNNGAIQIGNTGNVGFYGLYNEGGFNNNSGGSITVNRASTCALALMSNTFSNAGTVTIGNLVSTGALLNGDNGTFSNNTGGLFVASGTVISSLFNNAGGTVSPGYAGPGMLNFTGSESFANSTLSIEVNGKTTAVTQFDQVNVTGTGATATLGGTLNVSIGYTPAVGDHVTILTASTVTGTFSSVTGLPANWSVVYYPTSVALTYGTAQSTWTGAVSTAWTTAGNWTAGVPNPGTDVTIPDVARDPVISAAGAVAKSINVQSGGSLNVTAAGILAVNGSGTVGFLNVGTVNNSGTILVGNLIGPASHGVQNGGTFNNNSGALLTVDRISNAPSAVYSGNGTFTNAGTITIGGIASSGQHGLYVDGGSFTNAATGIINIDRARNHAVNTASTTFNNSGVINVGMTNTGTSVFYGFTLGNAGALNNLAGGEVNISRCNFGLYLYSDPFNNAGTVTIGEAGGVNNMFFSQGRQQFNNNTGGVFNASGNVLSYNFVNAGGTVSPGYSAPGTVSYDASEDFSSSTLQMEVNGKASAGSDYDRINVSGTAILGGTLVLNINYTPTAGDQMTLLSATALTGTFSSVTGLPAYWKLTYTGNAVVLSFDDRTTWTGAVSNAWNTAGNWTNGVPTAKARVIVPVTTVSPRISTTNAVALSVDVQPGATIRIASTGKLTVEGK